MITLSMMFNIVKKYVINTSQSDETIFNDLLSPFVIEGKAKNKNGEAFHIEKGWTSRIVNQKDAVPEALRNVLELDGIENKLNRGFQNYINDYIDNVQVDALEKELIKTATNEKCIISGHKELNEILTVMMIESVRNNNRKNDTLTYIYRQGQNIVDVVAADLLRFGFENRKKKRNIVVIPVNTSYETHITWMLENDPMPLVSENTIHGQWLKRWEQASNTIANLDERIAKSLKARNVAPVGNSDSPNGKPLRYPIGSIAVIEDRKAIYYLTAVSEFDALNKAHSCKNYVETAIERLLETYDTEGQGNDLYVPLIGTGRSRAGLCPQESFDCMTRKMLDNRNLLQGRIHIVIHPKQVDEVYLGEYSNGIL